MGNFNAYEYVMPMWTFPITSAGHLLFPFFDVAFFIAAGAIISKETPGIAGSVFRFPFSGGR